MEEIRGWCIVCGKITKFMKIRGNHPDSILCTECQHTTTKRWVEEQTKQHPFKTGIYYCKEVILCQ